MLIEDFIAAGLVPDKCRRIIIEISRDRKVTMYYETIPAEEKLQEIGLPEKILKGGSDINIKKDQKKPIKWKCRSCSKIINDTIPPSECPSCGYGSCDGNFFEIFIRLE